MTIMWGTLQHSHGVCGAGAPPAADASSACSVFAERILRQTRRAGRPPQARRLPHTEHPV